MLFDGFGGALDDAERDGAGAEHARQKEREQRVDGLGRRIGGEAHPPEQPDGSGKIEKTVRPHVGERIAPRGATLTRSSSAYVPIAVST